MRFIQWIAIFLPFTLFACSSTQPPSSAKIHAAIANTTSKITNAQTDTAKLKATIAAAVQAANKGDIDKIKLELSEANSVIDSLTAELLAAHKSASDSESKLQAFDQQNAQFEKRVNALESSRHRWVKFSWFSGIGLAASLVWILRVPIFALLKIASI